MSEEEIVRVNPVLSTFLALLASHQVWLIDVGMRCIFHVLPKQLWLMQCQPLIWTGLIFLDIWNSSVKKRKTQPSWPCPTKPVKQDFQTCCFFHYAMLLCDELCREYVGPGKGTGLEIKRDYKEQMAGGNGVAELFSSLPHQVVLPGPVSPRTVRLWLRPTVSVEICHRSLR